MNDLHRAHAALERIEATLKSYYGGMRNDAALNEIRKAVSEFQAAHDTAGYIGDKLGAIIPMAERLYCPSKRTVDLERIRLAISTYLKSVRNSIQPKPN
jgi:hypothetical protein